MSALQDSVIDGAAGIHAMNIVIAEALGNEREDYPARLKEKNLLSRA